MNRASKAGYLIVLALTLGCGSEPDDKIFGTYTLVAIQGALIPYHDFELSGGDCDVFVTEGELVLEPSGSYNLEFSGPRNCTGGEPPTTVGRVYSGTVSQSNGQLAFTADVEGAGPLQFTGSVNPLEAIVTVPPIPPQTGSNLTLQFAAGQ
jgi:hypothetical protein